MRRVQLLFFLKECSTSFFNFLWDKGRQTRPNWASLSPQFAIVSRVRTLKKRERYPLQKREREIEKSRVPLLQSRFQNPLSLPPHFTSCTPVTAMNRSSSSSVGSRLPVTAADADEHHRYFMETANFVGRIVMNTRCFWLFGESQNVVFVSNPTLWQTY